MVVVSFFTKKVPLNELGGLTWKTIGDPPISHGAIGEIDCAEKAENGGVHTEALELLEKKGKIAIWTLCIFHGKESIGRLDITEAENAIFTCAEC